MRAAAAVLALVMLPSVALGSILPRHATAFCKSLYPECSTKRLCNVHRHEAMKCMCGFWGALESKCWDQGAITDAFNDCCPTEKWLEGKTGNEDYGNETDEGYKLCRAIYARDCSKHIWDFMHGRRPLPPPPAVEG